MLTVFGLTIATYTGTALDNLLILALLIASGVPNRQVAAGFALGSVAVFLLSATATGLGEIVPPRYLGWVGLVPLGLGVAGLVDLFRPAGATHHEPAKTGVMSIAVAQLTASLDSVVAFAPLFAETRWPLGVAILAGFLLMTLVWLSLASRIARHPPVSAALGRVGRFLRPAVLILVGLYVIADTGSDRPPSAAVSDTRAGLTISRQSFDATPVSRPGLEVHR